MDSSLPRALHDAMSTRLGDGWLTGEGRRLYGGDDSRRWAMPSAVALPRTREDVVALVRACREHRVPLVARGAGTGTTGAAVPTQGGVVVSFARMDRILELRAADRCVVVEDSPAGITAAKSAGMRVVAFTGGSHARTPRHRETLLDLKPDALFDDMRELLQFVRNEKADGKEH